MRALVFVALLACGPSSAEVTPTPVDVAAVPAEGGDVPARGVENVTEVGLEAPYDVATPPEAAERSATGLAWRVLRAGDGAQPTSAADNVTVHYTGWTTDGERFDSSIERGTPATFPLNRVIAGWTEGVQLMREGEIRRLWIPPELAYGLEPRAGVPTGMLVFDVQLIEVTPAR